MALAQIDFSQIPAPAVVEALNFETILAAMKADLLARDDTLTAASLESDPISKVLEVSAYRELNLRQRVNDAAHAVMTAYASGSDLDQLGANANIVRLSGETDSALRSRIQQAFTLLSAAGPADAYKQHALAVDALIAAVSVVSLMDGQATVTVLAPDFLIAATATAAQLDAGNAAFPVTVAPSGSAVVIAGDGSAILNAVRTKLTDPAVKPLTDVVIVRAPTVAAYAITATLTIYPGPDASVVLADALNSLDGHLMAIRQMGFDATRSSIIAALTVPGVQRVDLVLPAADVVADDLTLTLATSIAVTVGGTNV